MSNKVKSTPISSRRRAVESTGSRILKNWQLECLAKQGTFTNLYFARPLGCTPDWPADYAVKMLKPPYDRDPLTINLLRREAEVGRNLSDPNLVPILESNTENEPYYVVMPRLSGASLREAISSVGRIAVPQALWITRQVAQALKRMHSQGWIHADIKPSNIVVSMEGHATLIDFGCALTSEESFYSVDRPLVGTLHYISPEMVTSKLRTDCRCDIYSLGVSLFEMLSGKLPFPYSDQGDLIQAHIDEVPVDLHEIDNDIPPTVANLVNRMLAKEPLRRPQTANELIAALADLELELLDSRFVA